MSRVIRWLRLLRRTERRLRAASSIRRSLAISSRLLERSSIDWVRARYFLVVQIIRPAAKSFVALALGEGAEAASVEADIGVIDVAVDDIAHRVAAGFGAPPVGGLAHRSEERRVGKECRL